MQGLSLKFSSATTHTSKNKYHKAQVITLVVGLTAVILGCAGLAWHNMMGQTPVSSSTTTLTAGSTLSLHNSYGIAAGSSLTNADSQTINKELDGIAALGAQWVRLDFDWSVIQPDNSSTFDWSQYDTIVAAAQQRHLHVLGILAYTPQWARSSACSDTAKCAPDPAQFATFAAAVASRYASQNVHYWEVWNEPNNPGFWAPKPDPSAYTELLKQASTALKKADASAYVVTAGLSPQATTNNSYSPIDFLSAVYKAGAEPYFDAVADHPYTFPLSPTSSADHAWNQMAATSKSLHQIMVTNGDSNKKMWITEFGAPTGGPGPISTVANPNLNQHPYVVDENLQKKIMLDALTLYKSYSWTGPFFWYSYKDAGNTPDTNENFFGLVRYDDTTKPAYDAYKSWISSNQ
jgi:GH35 family endo-1,4-beta-xylanase